eukprot:1094889-Pelagomonas_calceolata.AAC.4
MKDDRALQIYQLSGVPFCLMLPASHVLHTVKQASNTIQSSLPGPSQSWQYKMRMFSCPILPVLSTYRPTAKIVLLQGSNLAETKTAAWPSSKQHTPPIANWPEAQLVALLKV